MKGFYYSHGLEINWKPPKVRMLSKATAACRRTRFLHGFKPQRTNSNSSCFSTLSPNKWLTLNCQWAQAGSPPGRPSSRYQNDTMPAMKFTFQVASGRIRSLWTLWSGKWGCLRFLPKSSWGLTMLQEISSKENWYAAGQLALKVCSPVILVKLWEARPKLTSGYARDFPGHIT